MVFSWLYYIKVCVYLHIVILREYVFYCLNMFVLIWIYLMDWTCFGQSTFAWICFLLFEYVCCVQYWYKVCIHFHIVILCESWFCLVYLSGFCLFCLCQCFVVWYYLIGWLVIFGQSVFVLIFVFCVQYWWTFNKVICILYIDIIWVKAMKC